VIRPAKPGVDPEEFETHRTPLLRFAMLQVRDRDVAADLVQETMLAALTAAGRFSGDSSVRTWLTGILRHKIVDHIRKAGREVSVDALAGEDSADLVDAMFREDGHYVQMPSEWRDPERLLSERRFLEVLELCVRGLPATTAQAFLMRELMGCETGEICKELEITPTNCWVLLHRARMRLRACLEQRWFGGGHK